MDKSQSTGLLFEISHKGRRCHLLPDCDVPTKTSAELLDKKYLSNDPTHLPEMAEIDIVRHFVNLSTKNMAIDKCLFY